MVTLYEYEAVVISVHDGDTVRADIDLGFGIWKRNEPLRLLNLDAPEVYGEEKPLGIVSRDALRDRILGKAIVLRTVKPVDPIVNHDKRDKYGRYLAVIWDEFGCVNDWLIEAGYAVPYR